MTDLTDTPAAEHYSDPRSEMLAFVEPSVMSVLDVGCSGGAFGASLLAHRPDVRVTGVEPDPSAAGVAAERLSRVHVGTFPEVSSELGGERFDAVFFNDVLEHVLEPQVMLEAAAPLLRPNGYVVASIPNVRHVSVLGPLLVRDEWQYKPSGILDRTHLRFYTRTTMRRLFVASGYRVQRVAPINRMIRPSARPETAGVRAVCAATGGRLDGLFAMQFVLVAVPRRAGQ